MEESRIIMDPLSIKTIKWVCVTSKAWGSDQYQTPGKIYDVTVEVMYGEETYSFVGDDGKEYLLFLSDDDFIPLEEWRQRQLNKLL